MQDIINKIHLGNSVDIMKNIPDNSIDLTVTSPPYDKLRTYKGEIKDDTVFNGHFSFPFVDIATELFRITKDGGIVVWVVNDQIVDGGESGNSFRQALIFQSLGFKIYDTMIYHKNGAPFPETGRYSQVFEYMFVFLKGAKPNTVNIIKDKENRWSGHSNFGRSSSRTKEGEIKQGENYMVSQYGSRYNVWYINNGYGYTTKDKYAFDHPACVDPYTECLTLNGWKKYNEISIGDDILSYNMNINCLEWDTVKKVHINNYRGDMFDMSCRRLSILTTPNHRNVVRYFYDKIKIVESKDLNFRSHHILTSCENNNNINSIDVNLSYLLGIIITDGHYKRNGNRIEYIGITQDYMKNENKVNKILDCIKNLGLTYTLGKRERYYYYNGRKTVKNIIRFKKEFLKDHDDYKISHILEIRIWDKDEIIDWIPDKKICNKLFKLDKLSIQKIIEGIVDGDGSVRSDKSYMVTGKYQKFHDDLQILCVLGGYTSDYFEKINRYTQITKNDHKLLRNSKGTIIKIVQYEGIVWCPEVNKNGTFIARRDGKVFITGNSFPESLAEDHILSWSKEGDIVLDPMSGAGTTCKMAKMNNRNFIGIDIVPEYIDISKRRVNEVTSYNTDNQNPKTKFILSREDALAKRKRKEKS